MPRDAAIDVVRGLCITSMAASHLARGTWVDRVMHPHPWVDGASGFVLLSGLLVGIVQRKTIDAGGLRAGAGKILRRTRVIYTGHLWLCLVALCVAAAAPTSGERLPSAQDQGGWVRAVMAALTLRLNPYFASILSLYVVVMLVGVCYVALLHRGRVLAVGVIALALLVFGTVAPSWSALPREAGVPGPITLASWQAVFAVGLVVGWFWRHRRIRSFMRSAPAAVAAALVVATSLAVSVVPVAESGSVLGAALSRGTDKDGMGPIRLVVSVAAFYALYRLVAAALTGRTGTLLAVPLRTVGQRSLDCYLILSTVVLVGPSVIDWAFGGRKAVVLAAGVLLVCWCWASARRRLAKRAHPDPQTLAQRDQRAERGDRSSPHPVIPETSRTSADR